MQNMADKLFTKSLASAIYRNHNRNKLDKQLLSPSLQSQPSTMHFNTVATIIALIATVNAWVIPQNH
jgi:hypothetical protein